MSSEVSLSRINFNSHAHVERDAGAISMTVYSKHFNSHAHVERDETKSYDIPRFNISTHTLTWSVTIIVSPKL